MFRVLVLFCSILSLVAGEAEIRIQAVSTVQAARATLGDVAEIIAEPELQARLAAIPVAELPTLTPVPVDARLVTALATRTAAPSTLRIVGSGTVSRLARTFSTEELAAAAMASVPGARCELIRIGGAVTVPSATDLLLQAEPLDPAALGEVAFRVRALEGGRETGRTLVVMRVVRDVDIVLVTRDVARGEVLGAGDLRVERRSATRANLAAVLDPATVAGNVVRRDVRSGEPVTPSLIAVAPVVRAGRAVTAWWPGQGFSIQVEATALADGRSGERIGLRRVHDGSVFSGIAQPDGTVVFVR